MGETMRKLKILILTATMSLIMCFTALAGQWKQDSTGWWFQKDDGSYPAKTIILVDGSWYYFGEDGYMKTGWYYFQEGWLGFSESGACMNPRDVNGKPVAGPLEGWVAYSGSYEATATDLANGSVIYYNRHYWSDPKAYQEEVKYEHDVAPEPIKNRFGLSDMKF